MYTQYDVLTTSVGMVVIQVAITIEKNNNPKYNKLGGRTLYWAHNERGEDVFYWDRELAALSPKLKEVTDSNIIGEGWDD